MTDLERLSSAIASARPCLWIVTTEEEDALALVRDAAMERRRDLLLWSVSQGLRDGLVNTGASQPDTESAAGALGALARRAGPVLAVTLDLAPHLSDARTLRAWRDAVDHLQRTHGTLIMIDHSEQAPAVVGAHAERFDLSLPGDAEVDRIVRQTLRREHAVRPIEIDINRDQLSHIARNLRGLNRRQIERIVTELICEDRRLDPDDLHAVLSNKRRLLQGDGVLSFVEAPETLDRIGGLRRLKEWLARREGALSEEGIAFGLTPPRGVLLLGVQGAGKSLCAKAIAAAWKRPLLRLDPGALYNSYVGETERRLRDTLRQAEAMAPIILWIDEIEKGFASAASRSTDGGLSQRIFGTLLTWMQDHRAPVFLVATANDIEALPPELLRRGRFDEIFFVDLPSESVRREIFRIHLEMRGRDPGAFDLAAIARETRGFSGAEIEQCVKDALHDAFAGRAKLTGEHLAAVVRRTRPLSVTMAERVADLREWASDRCTPADDPFED